MTRDQLQQAFNTSGKVLLPVIHVLDTEQAERNTRIAIEGGAHGVFLINHDFPPEPFLPIIRHVRRKFSEFWLGVNFLGVTGLDAFPLLGKLEREDCPVNAYWADNARIDENQNLDDQPEARKISEVREKCGWNGLYFGGTAFKKQREVAPDKYETSARIASQWMDVVTTSGVATGFAPDLSKISNMRAGCGDTALALASGVTSDNAPHYFKDVDCFLVATGINISGDFYNLDPKKMALLLSMTNTPHLFQPFSKSR